MSFYSDQTYARFLPEKTSPVKRKTVKVNVDGHEITVSVKTESVMVRAFQSMYKYYDMYEARDHSLSREQVLERDDPKRKSDYMPRPEVSRHAAPLTDEEKEVRQGFIVDCYRLLNNDQIIEAIARFAPKKKNGTLYNKRHTRIASAGTVSDDFYVFEIEAYAKSDTELEIRGAWVDFDKELEQIEKDFLSTYPEIMTGKALVKDAEIKSVKSKKTSACTFVFKIYGSDDSLKVTIENENGVDMLDGIPLSKFNCLKKEGNTKYRIDVTAPAFAKIAGHVYDGYTIDAELTDLTFLFRNIFLSLKENNFTPWDDELYDLLITLKDYLASSGEKYAWKIQKWPKGIPAYKPKYSKEQSLAAFLRYVDRICTFTDADIQEALSKIERRKSSGAIVPNQRIPILEADFFVPSRGMSDFDRVYSGTVPNLHLRTPMNPPRRDIRFD